MYHSWAIIGQMQIKAYNYLNIIKKDSVIVNEKLTLSYLEMSDSYDGCNYA